MQNQPTKEQLLTVWDKNHTVEQICVLFGIHVKALYKLRRIYNLGAKPYTTAGLKNGRWKGGWSEYYGPNWERQRTACLKRDNYTCRRCGITQEEMDREPDVHHLQPIRTFNGDYDKANALPNLVSLCSACHTYCERHPHQPIPSEPDPSLRSNRPCPKKSGFVQPCVVDPQEVARRYLSGEKIQITLDELQIHVITYYRSLKRAGVQVNRKPKVDHTEVIRLAAEGLDKKQIAEKLGCSLLHLYRILPAEQPFSQQPQVVAKILELGRQGFGTRSIAKQTGAGRTQVKALLRRNGIGPAAQPRPAGGIFAKSKTPPIPDLQPCACGCGDTVDISTRKGARKLGHHYIHGHHRRGTILNANQLAAVSAHTFKPMDPAITEKVKALLGTMPQRQIAATLSISQGYVSKIAISQ